MYFQYYSMHRLKSANVLYISVLRLNELEVYDVNTDKFKSLLIIGVIIDTLNYFLSGLFRRLFFTP